MTATGDPALFGSLLVTCCTLWGMYELIACHLRRVYAEDDAGSGRWLAR